MATILMTGRDELIALCRKYRVRRLDVFGSAARDEFDEQSSDIDLLIEFDDMPYADRGDAYLGFLESCRALSADRSLQRNATPLDSDAPLSLELCEH